MAASILGLLLACVAVCFGAEDGWINARDCGASGSQFSTNATTVAGSNQITVKDVGDLKVGQGVMVSRCNVRYEMKTLFGPRSKYAAQRALKDEVEMRGYDGSAGSWVVYLIDVSPGDAPSFRWSDDLCRTWKGAKTPITGDWQPLAGGTEIKFNKQFDWSSGYTVTFSARDQLVATIEKIEGNVLTLKDAANRSASDAVVRHCDDAALQAAINRGIQEKRNVYVPPGCYRLAHGLTVANAAGITIEGVNGVDTVLDISEGDGASISLKGGTEVNLRNFRMIGHTGFADRDQAGVLPTVGGTAVWGFYLKPCYAFTVSGTERVLVENCHASKMSGECFYSGGPGRFGTRPEPKQYTKSLTYLRCSVTDSGRNAFNNNDHAENTSVLYCRIVDVGGCSWEGASRFVRFIGNYVRNAGTVAMGNIRSRNEAFEQLGAGQHIIADNVFESNVPYGGCAIRAAASATQVIIRNNLFVNFNSSAVELTSATGPLDMPASNSIVTGNIFDMTNVSDRPARRHCVEVSASDVQISDNQMYVRGACDPLVTGIRLREPAMNLKVHDNLIRNCGTGLTTARASSRISEVIDGSTFVSTGGGVPNERRQSHRYRGWNVVWVSGSKPVGQSVIEEFDPETTRFKLKQTYQMKVGDGFEVYPPYGANWTIHNNTITGCQTPIVLDSYGSETSELKGNIISRVDTTGVATAVVVGGRFDLTGNQLSGFDEPNSVALMIQPDRIGRKLGNLYRDNIFERCLVAVDESSKAAWETASKDGNQFISCGNELKNATTQTKIAFDKVTAPARPTLHAPKLTKPVTVDGDVTEWPWKDAKRVAKLELGPVGEKTTSPQGQLLAAWKDNDLYIALRVSVPKGAKIVPGLNWQGDGTEVAFRSGDPKNRTPIFMLWGTTDGTFNSASYGGASAEQVQLLEKKTAYAARVGNDEWTCELRIPLGDLGLKPATTRVLLFNLGVRSMAEDNWLAWAPTGAEIWRVDDAGELRMEK